MRSRDLTTEPQRHIDRLYLQCEEAISIVESLEDCPSEEYAYRLHRRLGMQEGIEYAYRLHRRLGHMSVKLKNAMISPMDFYVAVIRSVDIEGVYCNSAPEEESSLLEIIEANKDRDRQYLEESKKFIDDIISNITSGGWILQRR